MFIRMMRVLKTQPSSFLPAFLLALLVFVSSSCKKDPEPQPISQAGSVAIAGKEYSTMSIGNQVWTTVNHDGPGGIAYKTGTEKPEYGRYYTFEEAKAIALPAGWRLPTMQDYITLAESQGVVFTNFRATSQEAIKKLTSTTNWLHVAGSNASGFNAHPAGYSFENSQPMDGDICEFWTADGKTISIQEGAQGNTHNISFYADSNNHAYRFNLRFVKDR